MRYLSVCSGIEAATVAWHPLGWEAAAFAEIEAFPRAVLQHHHPDTPLHGDFTTIGADEYGPIELLVGGTPCQSFSIAGLRGGLADDRGNLALEFLRLADRTRPRWLVWENVPGVLSSGGGRDFGSILGGLVELGYGFAYRVLDAQHFGVPQRRRRVFVVGHSGDWRRAASVLLERHSLQGHPAPRRETGEGITASPGGIAGTCSSKWAKGAGGPAGDEHYNLIAHSLRAEGLDASEDGTGRGTPLVFGISRDALDRSGEGAGGTAGERPGLGIVEEASPTLKAKGPNAVAFTVSQNANGFSWEGEVNPTLQCRAQSPASNQFDGIRTGSAVRRLTPRECERLQGFPDGYTLIPWRGKSASECPDGPRYKALGNSMAVPVMRWIGERIAKVDNLAALRDAA